MEIAYAVILFILLPLGVAIYYIINNLQKKKELDNYWIDCENINSLAQQQFSNNGYELTNTIFIKDYILANKIILIDSKNKKIGLIDYSTKNIIIINFDELINYEIYENDNSMKTSGSISHSWFKPKYNSQTDNICNSLKFIIRLKKIDTPQICYDIVYPTEFSSCSLSKSSPRYKECIESMQKAASTFECIKNELQKTNQQ